MVGKLKYCFSLTKRGNLKRKLKQQSAVGFLKSHLLFFYTKLCNLLLVIFWYFTTEIQNSQPHLEVHVHFLGRLTEKTNCKNFTINAKNLTQMFCFISHWQASISLAMQTWDTLSSCMKIVMNNFILKIMEQGLHCQIYWPVDRFRDSWNMLKQDSQSRTIQDKETFLVSVILVFFSRVCFQLS